MKFSSINITPFLSALKESKIKAIMIYGPDKGVIDNICSLIVKNLSKTIYTYNYNESISKGLDVALNNISLFGIQDIIKITDVPASISSDLKEILLAGTHHIPILIADELSPSSSLRKLFETEEAFASIACYQDDSKNVRSICYNKISNSGKTINNDALNYLSSHLNGDRYIIENELDKLLLFASNNNSITLDDVEKSISKNVIGSPDFLCIAFAKGNGKKFFEEANNLLSDNISVVWIIRAISRYYINLYMVSNQVAEGASLESAIASLKPPIFFKYLNDFKEIANSNSLERIISILSLLHNAEAQSKSSTISPQAICDGIFFKAHYAT